MNIIEIAAIVAQTYPESSVLGSLPLPPSIETLPLYSVAITPTFVCGEVLLIIGAALRIVCYRHLGRHFTFELSLREEHKLVTDGPYAVVRHPSYTALFMYFAGVVLSLLGDGSWWAEYGIFTGLGRALGLVQVAIMTAWFIFFMRRTKLEDEVLSQNFREQWSRWSIRTPYKILPLVY